MKLAISNIAWPVEQDEKIYKLMGEYGFTGLEIAPTRVFGNHPYNNLNKSAAWWEWLDNAYGFCVPSMQSIWYGRQERLFGNQEEQNSLLRYTKEAVDFAVSIKCHNLVFGSPKNRNMPDGTDRNSIFPFFYEMGEYALSKGAVIGMEANPVLYHTNFMNYTSDVVKMVREVGSEGFRINLDVGTMLYNKEDAEEIRNIVQYISHVHISEPGLEPIERRGMHKELAEHLRNGQYQGYVSVEMSAQHEISVVEGVLEYIREIFG